MSRPRHRTGFTLVETALALLAISLGLLGIFGLARHGLKAGGDTENETRCALLADTVFETLKAKNDELAAHKVSLENWQIYWSAFLSQSTQPSLYLPPMPDISTDGMPIGMAVSVQPQPLTANPAAGTEIKWNPAYTLTLTPNSVNVGEFDEIDVTLRIHPGALQSGAEWRPYSTVLTYTGGLP